MSGFARILDAPVYNVGLCVEKKHYRLKENKQLFLCGNFSTFSSFKAFVGAFYLLSTWQYVDGSELAALNIRV